jgi:hypothetical protein
MEMNRFSLPQDSVSGSATSHAPQSKPQTLKTGEIKTRPVAEWKYVAGFSGSTDACRIYRDDILKAQQYVISSRKDFSDDWRGEPVFMLDGDPREFSTEEAMIDALIDSPKEVWVYAGTTRGNHFGHTG